MIVLLRTVLALGYIYVIGMGAYITFKGLPDYDQRTVAEREIDESIARAREITCSIYTTIDPEQLTAGEIERRQDCLRNQ